MQPGFEPHSGPFDEVQPRCAALHSWAARPCPGPPPHAHSTRFAAEAQQMLEQTEGVEQSSASLEWIAAGHPFELLLPWLLQKLDHQSLGTPQQCMTHCRPTLWTAVDACDLWRVGDGGGPGLATFPPPGWESPQSDCAASQSPRSNPLGASESSLGWGEAESHHLQLYPR